MSRSRASLSWRGRQSLRAAYPPAAQMRRFLCSGSRRKLRYVRLLVEAAAHRDALPHPLAGLLAAI